MVFTRNSDQPCKAPRLSPDGRFLTAVATDEMLWYDIEEGELVGQIFPSRCIGSACISFKVNYVVECMVHRGECTEMQDRLRQGQAFLACTSEDEQVVPYSLWIVGCSC